MAIERLSFGRGTRKWATRNKKVREGNIPIGNENFVSSKRITANPFYSNDIFLMQFTGLLDKNGKEIFEGDIINIGRWNQDRLVIFAHGMFSAVMEKPKQGCSLTTVCNGELGNACEIIGNIFENDNLLQDEK